MGSLLVNTDEYDLDQTIQSSTFGVRETDRKVELIVVDERHGDLFFAPQEFNNATRRLEHRSEVWQNGQGRETKSNWWFETVRVLPNNGIAAGDSVALAFYQGRTPEERLPISADIFPFKPHNAHKKTRGPFPLSRSFESQDEFLDWIEEQKQDYWQQTPSLIARLGRPNLLAHPPQSLSATLAYGLLRRPFTLDSVMQLLGSNAEVKVALSAIDSAAHQLITRDPQDAELIPQMPQKLQSNIFQFLTKLTLAGPTDNPTQWYSRPITEFFCFLAGSFRDHLANILMNQVKAVTLRSVAASRPSSPKPNDVRKRVEEAKKSLAELEAKKTFFIRRTEELRESIRTAENLLKRQDSQTDID